MTFKRPSIHTDTWTDGRLSTSGDEWLDTHQGKDFTMKPSLFSRIINKIKKISLK